MPYENPANGPDNTLDLEIIDQAFGRDADLHTDVLRISRDAHDGEIQHAFFERRKEIYKILNQIKDNDEDFLPQRRFAERRMDGIVMAFRVLKDPNLKEEYLKEQPNRFQRKTLREKPTPSDDDNSTLHTKDINKGMGTDGINNLKPRRVYRSSRNKKPIEFTSQIQSIPSDEAVKRRLHQVDSADAVKITILREDPVIHKQTSRRPNKINIRNLQPPSPKGTPRDILTRRRALSLSSLGVCESEDPGDDSSVLTSMTQLSLYQQPEGGILSGFRKYNIVKTVTEEVHGACLDTYSAFDQVFNAFTLQEKEIDAVCGRIEKAKQQFNIARA
eukprot:CAMPEP_0202455198 /NCGR_PEP_ID=MMETSP1360-20130828/12793_1 /ASSEMBLY_ACC=CAM_ASM_000848 /TAXON_ID=515479 /ORGANISM="Licmophora paradoxa, Strain CCMP2313" /LENGTH=330 /DNA_ID=CAMNT_0049074731 /DNA_START=228 /DNA_END=1220 /DNA_ORIENTATION=+